MKTAIKKAGYDYVLGFLLRIGSALTLSFIGLETSPVTRLVSWRVSYVWSPNFLFATLKICLNNSIAALTLIFGGILLSLAEIQASKTLSSQTYANLDQVADYFYKIVQLVDSKIKDLSSTERSIYFYLYAVPALVIVNGWLFGFFLAQNILTSGVTTKYLFFAIYGIPEISAIVLCAGIGFAIGENLRKITLKEGTYAFRKKWWKITSPYSRLILYALLLLIFAGFLEGWLIT